MQAAITLVIALFVGFGSAGVGAEPLPFKIAGKGVMRSLTISEEAMDAIQKIAPGFKAWKMKDYLPRIQEQLPASQASSAPFAVISDINFDGINDLVVDGATQKKSMTIVVLSSQQGYRAQVIESYSRLNPKDVQDVDEGGKVTCGLNRFISFEKESKLSDKSYAFTVSYAQVESPEGGVSDVAVVTYYFRKGKFISEAIEG